MTESSPSEESELDRTNRATRRVWIATTVALGLSLLMAVFVVTQVPLDTTVRYERNRGSFDLPLIVLVGIPAVLTALVIKTRKPETKAATTTGLWVTAVIAGVFLVACLVGQSVIVRSFLDAAAA